MTTLKSEWGRESLTVNDEIPTTELLYILGWVHAGTSDEEVTAIIEERIDRVAAHYTPAQREQTIAAALWLHHENRAEYTAVMSGRI